MLSVGDGDAAFRSRVVSGGWGPAASGHAPVVIFLIQHLAARLAEVKLEYHCYTDDDFLTITTTLDELDLSACLAKKCTFVDAVQVAFELVLRAGSCLTSFAFTSPV
eukprot:m.298869 g.298869  ORF g.298869 m.298869 type:complete len:107 (-) comp55178_c0_seq18:1171-1491(-)